MVVEDWSCLDTNAVILKGTTVLTYKPRLLDRPFSGSLAGIEVRGLPLDLLYLSVMLSDSDLQVRGTFLGVLSIIVTHPGVWSPSGVLLSPGQRAGDGVVHHRPREHPGGAVW